MVELAQIVHQLGTVCLEVMSIRYRYQFLIWSLLIFGLFACRRQSQIFPLPTLESRPAAGPVTPAGIGRTPEPAAPRSEGAVETPTYPLPTATLPIVPAWVGPISLPAPFSPQPLTPDEARTGAALLASEPPARDDLRLAREYRGVTAIPPSGGAVEQLALGDRAPFNVLNTDSNVVVPITATLLGAGDHAYFWFDDAVAAPDQQEMRTAEVAFDQIYQRGVNAFGPAVSPSRDGDARIHILHAAPAALCDVAEQCGLAGYFSGHDSLPRSVSAASNERKMFVMNADKFGTNFYLNVLAHEFRHMIENSYDPADVDWAVEGSATLAEELAGFAGNAHGQANAFLAAPDQQLNRWTDGNKYPYYGQGYLLNRYLYDRLGPELYRDFAGHPADGLAAVTEVTAENGLNLTGERLWEDWLAALAIHNHPGVPERYRLGDGSLEVAAMQPVADFPAAFDTTVHQYAADYYRLDGDQTLTIAFEGARRVPLLDTAPPSGRHFWFAHRANYSHLRLSRLVDLRPVVTATLVYSAWHQIEYGYDFAYLSASTDGGETWTPLVAEQMQGLLAVDNPAGKALADRFYTGESEGWITEKVDLTPYAGQEIWLRFSYITDPILTFGGLALDNIKIPEIGFYDDAEKTVSGWRAEGFTRATGTVAQKWHLQLITFPTGLPVVTPLRPGDNQRVTEVVDLAEQGRQAILVVAASAPSTLETAAYRLKISEQP